MQRYIKAGLFLFALTISRLNTGAHTPIELAAIKGHLQRIQEFHAAGHDLNQRYGGGQFSLLYLAIANRRWNLVRYLLEAGADARGIYFRRTLLSHSIECRCPLDICQQLLEQGIDVNHSSGLGKTALHEAASEGRVQGAKFLLERGAYPNATDLNGDTPLHKAVFFDHSDIVILLLAAGADPRIKNYRGSTPWNRKRNATIETLLKEAEKEISPFTVL